MDLYLDLENMEISCLNVTIICLLLLVTGEAPSAEPPTVPSTKNQYCITFVKLVPYTWIYTVICFTIFRGISLKDIFMQNTWKCHIEPSKC